MSDGQVVEVVVVVVERGVGKVDWVELSVVGVGVQRRALVPEEAVGLEIDELEVLVHDRPHVLPAVGSPLKSKRRKEFQVWSVFKANALQLHLE